MSKLTFILGGARSGKSSYAQKLARESGKTVTFIATAQALDNEMSARIQLHRAERPVSWNTLEIPHDVAAYLEANAPRTDVYLLDCITLLVNNICMQFTEHDEVDEEKARRALEDEIEEFLVYIGKHTEDWIVISNEVGLGLVPPYQMGRVYRDLLGSINQRFASEAAEVIWMVAGIPVPIHQHR